MQVEIISPLVILHAVNSQLERHQGKPLTRDKHITKSTKTLQDVITSLVTSAKMAVQYLVLLFSLSLLQIVCLDLGFPANEYEYSVKRDSLLEKEKQFAGESLPMSEVGKVIS